MRVMIAGGGTGGHVYPGVALVDELRALDAETKFLWIGTRDRIEARAVPAAGIPIEFLKVSFLKGRRGIGLLKSLASLPWSGWQAMKAVRAFRPDALVGLGGFVSGPVVVAAFLQRVPVYLLEQNAIPGRSNRISARFARRVFGTFRECEAYFPAGRTVIAGNPIRREILECPRVERRPEAPIRVLVFGGSQGATSLNESVPALLCRAASEAGVRLEVTHGSGRGRAAGIAERYDAGVVDVKVVEYIDDMASVYARSDFVVCRAGATTISELTAVGLPACYVPFPFAADDHQTANARSVADVGGGLVIPDERVADDAAVRELADVLGSEERLRTMAANARRVGRPDAGEVIARTIRSELGLTRLGHEQRPQAQDVARGEDR